MMPDSQRLKATVAHVDKLLHARRYLELEEFSGGVRLKAEHIEAAIREYPEELAPRPDYDVEDMSVVYVRGSVPPAWSVYLHLWRAAGGRSDLTAELTLKATRSGFYAVEIDDIRVL